jgi:hypothetical protein
METSPHSPLYSQNIHPAQEKRILSAIIANSFAADATPLFQAINSFDAKGGNLLCLVNPHRVAAMVVPDNSHAAPGPATIDRSQETL